MCHYIDSYLRDSRYSDARVSILVLDSVEGNVFDSGMRIRPSVYDKVLLSLLQNAGAEGEEDKWIHQNDSGKEWMRGG
ncbi:hypothetical protein L596_009951 [Steinernema carpocapsae]|uniref:Uncharacterized protein n=1 Tax=Steinernema carpocapsae TaxID=34508 RepID=A0A4U5PHC7_STECR|nr:hypothetical protein L596_009951 [Steinernema carpocapsae]